MEWAYKDGERYFHKTAEEVKELQDQEFLVYKGIIDIPDYSHGKPSFYYWMFKSLTAGKTYIVNVPAEQAAEAEAELDRQEEEKDYLPW